MTSPEPLEPGPGKVVYGHEIGVTVRIHDKYPNICGVVEQLCRDTLTHKTGLTATREVWEFRKGEGDTRSLVDGSTVPVPDLWFFTCEAIGAATDEQP